MNTDHGSNITLRAFNLLTSNCLEEQLLPPTQSVYQLLLLYTASSLQHTGPALGMFEVFGRTGPPILGGRQYWHSYLVLRS